MNPILSRRTLVSWSSVSPPSESPSTWISADEGRSSPTIRLRSVDFPDPDGPMIETSSPFGMRRETSSRATTPCAAASARRLPSNCLLTRWSWITGTLCECIHKYVKLFGNRSILMGFRLRPRRLDSSGAAKTDRDLVPVDDDRDGAPPLAELEHPLQLRGVLLDVDVGELDMPPCIVVTGGLRVGSGVLAEDLDHPSIVRLPPRRRCSRTRTEPLGAVKSSLRSKKSGIFIASSADAPAPPASRPESERISPSHSRNRP